MWWGLTPLQRCSQHILYPSPDFLSSLVCFGVVGCQSFSEMQSTYSTAFPQADWANILSNLAWFVESGESYPSAEVLSTYSTAPCQPTMLTFYLVCCSVAGVGGVSTQQICIVNIFYTPPQNDWADFLSSLVLWVGGLTPMQICSQHILQPPSTHQLTVLTFYLVN